jgi:alkanesulfonate monooxygenase SsuD/methylene tetrahydromethanopterin reductase-like flavin-dependent oxidoreductase (luciferase family)
MQAWYLNENPYPFVPPHALEAADSVRGSLPNRYCDPKIAADLFQEALDEYLLCDDIGINVVSNEHHAGINCLFGASPLILGILARQTRNVRILSLGTLITVRTDPVRVAEEYATADAIGIVERFWEAIDLILKALSYRDGPFSWEGKHFTHRHVNIWPGPWQQPHPPLWAATGDPTTSAELGRRGIVNVMVFRTAEETTRAWAAYRSARAEAGLPAPGPDRFGHTAFVYTGDTDEEGVRVGSKLLWFLNTGLRSAPQYGKLLPGAIRPELAPALYTTKPRPGVPAVARPAAGLIGITAEQAMAKGLMFAGDPDSVYRQIREYRERVGPFEHLVLASRSGFMTHAEATKGLRLFAKEVLPRLREL